MADNGWIDESPIERLFNNGLSYGELCVNGFSVISFSETSISLEDRLYDIHYSASVENGEVVVRDVDTVISDPMRRNNILAQIDVVVSEILEYVDYQDTAIVNNDSDL